MQCTLRTCRLSLDTGMMGKVISSEKMVFAAGGVLVFWCMCPDAHIGRVHGLVLVCFFSMSYGDKMIDPSFQSKAPTYLQPIEQKSFIIQCRKMNVKNSVA
jgi:hypothetical protein